MFWDQLWKDIVTDVEWLHFRLQERRRVRRLVRKIIRMRPYVRRTYEPGSPEEIKRQQMLIDLWKELTEDPKAD